jgi:hypothetical protein
MTTNDEPVNVVETLLDALDAEKFRKLSRPEIVELAKRFRRIQAATRGDGQRFDVVDEPLDGQPGLEPFSPV